MPYVGRPKPTAEVERAKRRFRSAFQIMCGPITGPLEITPYTEGSSPHESYVWDKNVGRYRWCKGTKKAGKFHCVPDVPHEQRRYREYIDRRRKDALQKKQGNRLKIR